MRIHILMLGFLGLKSDDSYETFKQMMIIESLSDYVTLPWC